MDSQTLGFGQWKLLHYAEPLFQENGRTQLSLTMHLPTFYKRILDNFNELKTLYNYYQKQDRVLFFISEWFKKGIISIKDLLTENGKVLTFHEFSLKCSCQTNFFSVLSSCKRHPEAPLSIAKQTDDFNKSYFITITSFPLAMPSK